jgi:hypothetical protein
MKRRHSETRLQFMEKAPRERSRRIFANGLEAARRSKLSGAPQRKLIKRAARERRASRVRRAARRFLADEFAVSYPQAAISRLCSRLKQTRKRRVRLTAKPQSKNNVNRKKLCR